MTLSTSISRVSDALPLVASIDDEATESSLKEQKQQSKLVLRRLSPNSEPRCSIESGNYTLHYLISEGVCYLCIAERSYPRKLAFSYLDELSKEFDRSHGKELGSYRRPYACQPFDSFIHKTTRLYADPRTAAASASAGGGHLDKLNEDLQDVTRIMTKNMEDLLWRGDSLDRMSHLSTSLRDESLKYRRTARQVNIDALIRKWAPVGAIVFIVLVLLWWRFW